MPGNSQRWKIYSLGGGLGHIQRALALSRVAVARGHRIDLLVNSRFAPHLPWQDELPTGGQLTAIPHAYTPQATSAAVADWLQTGAYDCVVVDTFPRGLAGELPTLFQSVSVPTILVHRDLNPEYMGKFNLTETARRFDLVIAPGEEGPLAQHVRVEKTAPWLLRDFEELLAPAHAREKLEVDAGDQRPLLLVCNTGSENEQEQFRELASALADHLDSWIIRSAFSNPETGQIGPWPLLPLLGGVRALIGAGGYNLVHEARATGTRLFAFPQPRRYDRQALRLTSHECVHSLSDILAGLGNSGESKGSRPYVNGAHRAANLVEQCVGDV